MRVRAIVPDYAAADLVAEMNTSALKPGPDRGGGWLVHACCGCGGHDKCQAGRATDEFIFSGNGMEKEFSKLCFAVEKDFPKLCLQTNLVNARFQFVTKKAGLSSLRDLAFLATWLDRLTHCFVCSLQVSTVQGSRYGSAG